MAFPIIHLVTTATVLNRFAFAAPLQIERFSTDETASALNKAFGGLVSRELWVEVDFAQY